MSDEQFKNRVEKFLNNNKNNEVFTNSSLNINAEAVEKTIPSNKGKIQAKVRNKNDKILFCTNDEILLKKMFDHVVWVEQTNSWRVW